MWDEITYPFLDFNGYTLVRDLLDFVVKSRSVFFYVFQGC